MKKVEYLTESRSYHFQLLMGTSTICNHFFNFAVKTHLPICYIASKQQQLICGGFQVLDTGWFDSGQ